MPRLIHFLLISSSFWGCLALLISLGWITRCISLIFWIIFLLLIVDIADYHSTLAMTPSSFITTSLAMATFTTHQTSPLPIPLILCTHPIPNKPHESATTFSFSTSSIKPTYPYTHPHIHLSCLHAYHFF